LIDASIVARKRLAENQAVAVATRFRERFGVPPLAASGKWVQSMDGLVLYERAIGEFVLLGLCPKCKHLCFSDPVVLEDIVKLVELFVPSVSHKCGEKFRLPEGLSGLVIEAVCIAGAVSASNIGPYPGDSVQYVSNLLISKGGERKWEGDR